MSRLMLAFFMHHIWTGTYAPSAGSTTHPLPGKTDLSERDFALTFRAPNNGPFACTERCKSVPYFYTGCLFVQEKSPAQPNLPRRESSHPARLVSFLKTHPEIRTRTVPLTCVGALRTEARPVAVNR